MCFLTDKWLNNQIEPEKHENLFPLEPLKHCKRMFVPAADMSVGQSAGQYPSYNLGIFQKAEMN